MLSLSARTSCWARWTVFTGALWVPGLLSFPPGDTNTLPGMLAACAVETITAAVATASAAADANSQDRRYMSGEYIRCQADPTDVSARRDGTSGRNVPPLCPAVALRGPRRDLHPGRE